MLERIGTYASHLRLVSDINKTQSEIGRLQYQLSSGLKSQNFEGLNGQVELYTGLNTKVSRTETYIRNNAQVISRLGTMSASLDAIEEISSKFNALLVGERSPSQGVTNLIPQVKAMLASLSSQLNNTLEGRYIFAGSKTDTQPVPTDLLTANQGTQSQTPNDAYYKGDNVKLSTKGSDSLDITYGITANDEAFQNLIAAMFTVINGEGKENYDAYIASAVTLGNKAHDQIVTLQAQTGANQKALEDANTIQTSFRLYWKGFAEDVAATDIAEATTQVAVQETIIQATFQAFATINNLNLSDYL